MYSFIVQDFRSPFRPSLEKKQCSYEFSSGYDAKFEQLLYKENNVKIPSPGTEQEWVRGCLGALKFETLCIGTDCKVDHK